MKFFLIVLSAVAVVKGSDSGFASSYNSVSGKQYHPQAWNQEIHPQHIPVIDKHGVPEETPEVKAAKHHFYAEYARAAALAAEHPDPLMGTTLKRKLGLLTTAGKATTVGGLLPTMDGAQPKVAGLELTVVGNQPTKDGLELTVVGKQLARNGLELTMDGMELAMRGMQPTMLGKEQYLKFLMFNQLQPGK
ncbi:hypothetical protein WA026_000062 [Henosepilachna vigintioctopunctata]|uniref:Secreted protein n=1 Tax=Henosepilachna vigintioctopunctata TaxID=420089 RepID=A0AAW1V4L8_9CUCU